MSHPRHVEVVTLVIPHPNPHIFPYRWHGFRRRQRLRDMMRSRLQHSELDPMDLQSLLERNRRSLTKADPTLNPREQRAHDQFAREYAEQSRMTREALLGSAK